MKARLEHHLGHDYNLNDLRHHQQMLDFLESALKYSMRTIEEQLIMSNVNQEPRKDSQVSEFPQSQVIPATAEQDSSHSDLQHPYEVYSKSQL